MAEGQHTRRPDVVLFVNGLPLAVIELKNPADENATVWSAYQQLQTYQAQIPALFATNAALVVSDGVQARIGALGAGKEWFKPWRTITGREDAAPMLAELQVVLEGVFEQRRFLDLVRHFIVFEDAGGGKLAKKMAGYHQFHAVNVAVEETLRALAHGPTRAAGRVPGRYEAGRKPGGDPGDRRVGVVWHTQGSGKSLTMAFYAGRVILHPAMENPTIVVLTDRNDLDDQLFGTFARCQDCCARTPVQAAGSRRPAREAAGRVRRRGLHHDPEVLPRGEGRPAPGPLGAAQHRRDRRRGPPQPVRLHRRLRPAHARCAAERLVHRLHRHAHREDRRQHPRRLRRLHQRLRHPAGGRGRGDGPDLLREPAGQAGAEGVRAAEDRSRVRGGHRRRRGRAQGEAQDASGRSSKPWSGRRSGSS